MSADRLRLSAKVLRERAEALARVLGCDPYDVQTRPLSVDGVPIGGGIERRCRTHNRAWRECPLANAAERIIADPGPLLAALAEAGVLTEEQAIRMGRKSEPGPVLTWVGGYRHTTHADAEPPFTVPVSRYVTEWGAKP